MFGFKKDKKKVRASVVLYEKGHAEVKASLFDVSKLYLACRRVLVDGGVDIQKVEELQEHVKVDEV